MPSDPRPVLAAVLAHPLTTVLRNPGCVSNLSGPSWRIVLSTAYLTSLMGIVVERCRGRSLPAKVRRWIDGSEVQMAFRARMFGLETAETAQLLAGASIPAMFLKGGAYHALRLPLATGRISIDIDVMVPGGRLGEAEQLLRGHGWVDAEVDGTEHDREYFRQWLHELPPLKHPERIAFIDLHHNVLPRTDRRCFDPQVLWDAAERVESGMWVPCAGDLVLHASAHLFRNGRFHHGIRDLHDIGGLLARIEQIPGGWSHLLERAHVTGLRSSLALALRYVTALFDTPVPEHVAREAVAWLPPGIRLLDHLVAAALLPRHLDRVDQRRAAAIAVLAHLPPPRLQVMTTRLFWAKRFAKAEPQLTAG